MAKPSQSSPKEVQRRLDELAYELVLHESRLRRISAKLDSDLAAVKARYKPELADSSAKHDAVIAKMETYVRENYSVIFADNKSKKLLFGVLSSREVGGKEVLNLARLLVAARKRGVVRKLFSAHFVYELRGHAKKWIEQHPEEEWVQDCYDSTPKENSVTFKPDPSVVRQGTNIDSRHLTNEPIRIGRYPFSDLSSPRAGSAS